MGEGGKCKERHSILAPKYTSILEGQKACYSGQTLDVQWCCHLINLFFVSKGKPVKGSTYSIVAYISSPDLLSYRISQGDKCTTHSCSCFI